MFSAGSDREIRRWQIGFGSAAEVEPSPIIAHETSIDAVHFDSDGDIWTASADKTAKCLSRGRNCRDEEVRVWEKGSGKLHHVFSGHFEEVTGLVLLPGQRLVSVSIDATVRQWSLKAHELAEAVKEAEDEQQGKIKEKELEKKEPLMTAEEEAELAELLEDSD